MVGNSNAISRENYRRQKAVIVRKKVQRGPLEEQGPGRPMGIDSAGANSMCRT